MVINSTSISATVPAGATTGPISVIAPGGSAVSPSNFIVIPPPVITSLNPSSGPVSIVVQINGSNFSGATQVSFNGVSATYNVISSTTISATVPFGATTGLVSVTTPGGTATSPGNFTVTTPPVSIMVRVFIQGYYAGNSTMNAAVSSTTADNFILRLASSSPPYGIAYSAAGTVDINGYGTFTFFGPSIGSSWYLVLQQRNTLETWSSSPLTITGLSNNQYDFTTAANKAFGNNMAHLGNGIYGIWSGDVNQDGLIESSDYSVIENDLLNFLSGYYSSDLTGDNLVESLDYSLIENNLLLFLFTIGP